MTDDKNICNCLPTPPTLRPLARCPSVAELKQGEIVMIKTTQMEAYAPEIKALERKSSKSNIAPKSSICTESFTSVDEAEQMFEEKHPAILSKQSDLAKLAITITTINCITKEDRSLIVR